MSYNPVWSEFEKIMSDKGFFKTAKERDKDYDVIPDSGEGLLAEESGYDLIENIAHPEQVQVAESTLNDGIVENGVEQQKMMIDVALRQPRGVLADLIKKLVSLANQHDAELTHDGFKLAQEIDELVVKIAQQQQPLTSVAPVGDGSVTDWGSGVFTGVGMGAAMLAGGPLGWVVGGTLFLNEAIDYAHKKVGDLYEGFRKAAQYLRKLDFGGYLTTLSGQTQAQKELETRIADIANVLDGYGQLEIVYNNDPNSLILSTYQAIQFINNTSSFVTSALKQTTDLSGDPRKAEVVWNRMANFAQKWLNVTRERVLQLKQQNNVQQPNMSMDPSKLMSVPPMAAQPQQEVGVNSKMPPMITPLNERPITQARNYSVFSPQVKELQQLVGSEPDSKFGPKTLAAVLEEAKNNYNLKELLHVTPTLSQGYQNWGQKEVEQAISMIKKFRQTKAPQQDMASKMPSKYPDIIDPYKEEDERFMPPADPKMLSLISDLKRKYPAMTQFNRRIYPYGYGLDSRKYPSFPSYDMAMIQTYLQNPQ